MIQKDVLIVGAGPAGLTAAYLLTQKGLRVAVLEKDPRYVGGISRTEHHEGFFFDIGGHRFFSKSQAVNQLWHEIMPDGFIVRKRKSQIFYKKKFFSYPLKPFEALLNLGIFEAISCVASYFISLIRPHKKVTSFQDWVENHFGRRLFQIFFKSYTEKVWGVPCNQISSDWAAQRIKGFSLGGAILSALKLVSNSKFTTTIEHFIYPRRGPGMFWETCAQKIQALGGKIEMGYPVTKIRHEDDLWKIGDFSAPHLISSAAIVDLVRSLSDQLPREAMDWAQNLQYRHFVTVCLVFKGADIFDDQWIYIHDPDVKVGRIQNFKSWSPEMVPNGNYNSYGLEYFCFEDSLWKSSDEDLIALGLREFKTIGLATGQNFVKGFVIRQSKAYPVYNSEYKISVEKIRQYLAPFPNLHLVGRNGMHKYNNQDHAMMTAMLTAKNILSGESSFDPWLVNQDAEYHESGATGDRLVPTRLES